MKHAREDYNGRVVDLAEERIRNAFSDLCDTINDLLLRPDTAEKIGKEMTDALGMATANLGEVLYGGAWITGQTWVEWEATHKPIPENEPVFLLRGQDIVAADVVDHWSALASDADLVASARLHAREMRVWPVKKPADG